MSLNKLNNIDKYKQLIRKEIRNSKPNKIKTITHNFIDLKDLKVLDGAELIFNKDVKEVKLKFKE